MKRNAQLSLAVVVLLFAGAGGFLLIHSHAATPTASVEAESGTPNSPATTVPDTTASGNQATKFNAAAANSTAKPDATNTGVPAGTTLTTVNGNYTASTAGAVVSGLHVTGTIFVTADNVTIQNCQVDGNGTSGVAFGIKVMGNNDIIRYDTVAAPNKQSGLDGLAIGFDGGSNATIDHLNISGTTDGIKVYATATITYNYVHDLTLWATDPVGQPGGGGSHNDGSQMQAGANVTYAHNNFTTLKTENSGIQVTQDSGPVSNLHIDSNWLDGGGCTLNIGAKTALTSIYFTNNRFGHNTGFANCPVLIGTKVSFAQNTGNVFDDTGAPINIQQHD